MRFTNYLRHLYIQIPPINTTLKIHGSSELLFHEKHPANGELIVIIKNYFNALKNASLFCLFPSDTVQKIADIYPDTRKTSRFHKRIVHMVHPLVKTAGLTK